MRCIVIAAGKGSRLEHHTEQCPKCMVKVGGRSILDHQLEALRANGVDELHIVRGYLADKLVVPGATYWHNASYEENNILHSLFMAEEAMQGSFLTTYSDIVYRSEVVEQLLASPHDVALVVDAQWRRAYEGRLDHPVGQAELVEAEGDRVWRVGKWVGEAMTAGEFIGLAKFSEQGGRWLKQVWREVRARRGDEEPFQHAWKFRKAYLTDLFMEMIERGMPVHLVEIEGDWREIDTVEDLRRAEREGY